EALKVSAERFADDPCYLPKREAVVQAARALLAAVTRLLVLADMIDVMCLLQHVSAFQRTFESLKNVSNKSDLKKTYQKLGKELENLDYLAFKRQQIFTEHLPCIRYSDKMNKNLFRSQEAHCPLGKMDELWAISVQGIAILTQKLTFEEDE
ncbi:hypothetical protein MG293_020631, partial [Ovis ammon polii]